MRKVNNIEMLRIVLTLLIAIHHFCGTVECNIIPHAYLAVEFFFMLSGYLLIDSCHRHPQAGAVEYTTKKIKRLYPHYLLSFAVLYFAKAGLELIGGTFGLKSLGAMAFQAMPEILFIQNIGIYDGGLNYPLWYLSVLIIGGHLLYYLVRRYEDIMVNVIFPIFIICTFTYIFSLGNSIEIWSNSGGIYLPLARGISDMGIGILCYKISSKLPDTKNKLYDLFYLLGIVFIVFLFISPICYDRYALIVFPILIVCGFRKDTLIEKTISRYKKAILHLSELSYPVYLNHSFIIRGGLIFCSGLGMEFGGFVVAMYLGILFLYSELTNKCVKIILERCSKKCSR